MDLEELKREIKSFEDRAINNPDFHFNNFILADYKLKDRFDSNNQDDFLYLIEDDDWYLYWISLAKEVYDILEPLIQNNDEVIDDPFNQEGLVKILNNH